MRYYASKGLCAPIDDVWDKVSANYSDAMAKATTGDDGKKYFVPIYNYPWGFLYRKSVWQSKGYAEPATFDDLKTFCEQMKEDGLTPIAFADKDPLAGRAQGPARPGNGRVDRGGHLAISTGQPPSSSVSRRALPSRSRPFKGDVAVSACSGS
jgi:ABC-type glycerol-3-phosphate transport system substrate-binding protein